jgi:hypothetical protein
VNATPVVGVRSPTPAGHLAMVGSWCEHAMGIQRVVGIQAAVRATAKSSEAVNVVMSAAKVAAISPSSQNQC